MICHDVCIVFILSFESYNTFLKLSRVSQWVTTQFMSWWERSEILLKGVYYELFEHNWSFFCSLNMQFLWIYKTKTLANNIKLNQFFHVRTVQHSTLQVISSNKATHLRKLKCVVKGTVSKEYASVTNHGRRYHYCDTCLLTYQQC